MPMLQRIRLWLRNLIEAIEAVEEGPYGHMERQMKALSDRVQKLESER